jgi:hypothetical protein
VSIREAATRLCALPVCSVGDSPLVW